VKEKNEEETFKEKTGKKGKNKNPEVWEDLKLQFEIPLQIPGKTDKVNFKISSEKESKLNGWKKKIYQYLGKKMHRVEENMKSPLEFSTARL